MHSVIATWILFMALVTISDGTVSYSPGPIEKKPGETMIFKWTSDKKILEAAWGIRSGNNLADPRYIFVRSTNEDPVVNPALPSDLKKRVNYTGNLTAGRAWFNLTSVTLSDSNTYIGIILEEEGSPQPYYIELIVAQSTTPSVSTTSQSSAGTKSTSSTPTSTPAPSITTVATVPPTTAKGLSVGEIIGIAIGSVVGVICIIVIVVVLYKRYKKKREQGNLPADKKEDTEMNSPPAVNA